MTLFYSDFSDEDLRELELRRELNDGAHEPGPPCEGCGSSTDSMGFCDFCGHVTPRPRRTAS